jgi:hypothetical protein
MSLTQLAVLTLDVFGGAAMGTVLPRADRCQRCPTAWYGWELSPAHIPVLDILMTSCWFVGITDAVNL